jgi:subtilisin-like proprotein convertase family protein
MRGAWRVCITSGRSLASAALGTTENKPQPVSPRFPTNHLPTGLSAQIQRPPLRDTLRFKAQALCRHLLLPLFALLISPTDQAESADLSNFSNPNPIVIPDQGPALPFPSTIVVSGLTGLVSQVVLSLHNLNHPWIEDLSILLVGPGGGQVMVLSRAGRDCQAENLTLLFDDAATCFVPIRAAIGNGSYKPTDYVTSRPMTGIPGGPRGTTLTSFAGCDPNGIWSLFVVDDIEEDQGSIDGGWSLQFATTADSSIAPKIRASNNAADLEASLAVSGPFANAKLQAWQIRYFSAENLADPAKAEDVWGDWADPDHDGRHNLLEYALGLNPLDPSDRPLGLRAEVRADDHLHYHCLSYSRSTEDLGLLYIPQVSGDQRQWLSDTNAVVEVSAIPLDAGQQWVTVQDLSPIGPGQPRFFRLRILRLSGSQAVAEDHSDTFVATATTIHQGLPPGSQLTYFSLSMVQPVFVAGTISALGAYTLADTNATWPAKLLAADSGAFYVEFDSGLSADIVAAHVDTKSLTLPGDLRALLPLGAPYRVRRHTTLADVFGPHNEAGLLAGADPSVADLVALRDNQTQTSKLYYFKTVSGASGWYRADEVEASNTRIYPEQGLQVSRKASRDLVIYLSGLAKEGPTLAPVAVGLNVVGVLKAAKNLTLSELNLYTGNTGTGLAAGSSPAWADQVIVSSPDGPAVYFFSNIPGNEGWLDGMLQSARNVSIPAGGAFFIVRKPPNGPFQWLIPAE